MRNRLTPRQRQIVKLIGDSAERLSIRELSDKTGVSNPISMQRELAELQHLGWITSDRRLKRKLPRK